MCFGMLGLRVPGIRLRRIRRHRNPLGARALYLGKTAYRIHGTNQPSTIGTVSLE